MSISITISDTLYEDAKQAAAATSGDVAQQVEYWSKIGRIAIDNPDLPVAFIQDICAALEEVDAGQVSEFRFGETD